MSVPAIIPIPVSFLDDVPAPTILIDLVGQVLYCNIAAHTVFGWKQHQEAGDSFFEVLPSLQSKRLQKALNNVQGQEKGKVKLSFQEKDQVKNYTLTIAAHPVDNPFYYLLSFHEEVVKRHTANRKLNTDVSQQQPSTTTQVALIQHSAFIRNSVDGLFAFDLDMRYTLWNPYMEELTGKPKEQVLGNKITDVFPYIEFHDEYTYLKEAVKGEYFQVKRRQSHFKDERFHDGYLFPLNDARQEVIGAMCILHEVTQQVMAEEDALKKAKLLQEAQRLAQTILSNSPVGIFTYNGPEVRISSWNHTLEAYTGVRASEILDRSAFDFFPYYRSTPLAEHLQRVLQGETLTYMKHVSEDGKRLFNGYLMPIVDDTGAVTGGVGHFQEITEQVQLERKNAQAAKEKQLAVLQAVLHAQEEEKKRISEMLHNNLGQLLYGTGMQLKQYLATEKLSKKHKQFLQKIEGLVTEAIVDTKRISFELMPSLLQDFGLGVAIEELAKKIVPASMQVQICVELSPKRLVAKLEVCLYRIVQELLNNAIKHAQATSATIHIRRSGKMLEVSVHDNGIGYTHPPKPKKSGTGLVTIQNRVNAQGGSWSVDSGMGKGTKNHLQFPIKSR